MASEEQEYQDYLDYQAYKASGGGAPNVPQQPELSGMDLAVSRLTNPDNWRDLASSGLRGLGNLGDFAASAADWITPGQQDIPKPSGYLEQLAQAISGQDDAMKYGKGTPLGAVGEMLGGGAVFGPAQMGATALSAMGAGVGNKADGPTGEFLGSLLPAYPAIARAAISAPSAINRLKQALLREVADPSSLSDPSVQTALGFAERSGYLNKPAEKLSRIGEGTASAISTVNKKASMLPENIAAQLGAAAGDSQVEKAIAKQFSEAAPELIESGIFEQAASVDDLGNIAAGKLKQINKSRAAAADALDQATSKINSAETKIENMTGVITNKSPEIQESVKKLNKRISQLNFNELSKPIANSLQQTKESILRDLTPKKDGKGVTSLVSAGKAVAMQKNLNEVRRNLLREFDALNVAKQIDGNTPGNLSSIEASIEAVSELQRAISRALESSVADVSRSAKLGISADHFTKLNKEYGALSSLQDMTDKFLRGTAKGRAVRDPTRIVQNTGGEQLLPSAFSTGRNMAGNFAFQKLNQAMDVPNDTLRRAMSVESRDTDALMNIQALMSLNKNPAVLTPIPKVESLNKLAEALQSSAIPLAIQSQK